MPSPGINVMRWLIYLSGPLVLLGSGWVLQGSFYKVRSTIFVASREATASSSDLSGAPKAAARSLSMSISPSTRAPLMIGTTISDRVSRLHARYRGSALHIVHDDRLLLGRGGAADATRRAVSACAATAFRGMARARARCLRGDRSQPTYTPASRASGRRPPVPSPAWDRVPNSTPRRFSRGPPGAFPSVIFSPSTHGTAGAVRRGLGPTAVRLTSRAGGRTRRGADRLREGSTVTRRSVPARCAICEDTTSPEYAVAATMRHAVPTLAANQIGRGPRTPRASSVVRSTTPQA